MDEGPDGGRADGAPAVGEADANLVPTPRQVRLRRAPRYRAFVISGAVLGVLIAAVLNRVAVADPTFSSRSTFGYLAVILGLIGGVLGGAIALLVERRQR